MRADFQIEALRNEEVREATGFPRTSAGADVLQVVWPIFQTDLSRHRPTSRQLTPDRSGLDRLLLVVGDRSENRSDSFGNAGPPCAQVL